MDDSIIRHKLKYDEKTYKEVNKKNRVEYIDVARGISILLMIIGHVIKKGPVRNIINSFHMPLFIIISGYFFKEKENPIVFAKKIIKGLILPYVLTVIIENTINMFILNSTIYDTFINILKQLILSYSYEGKIPYYDIEPTGVLWFITSLICAKIMFYVIEMILNKKTFEFGLISYIVLCIGFYFGKNKIWLPLSLDISFVFVFLCI